MGVYIIAEAGVNHNGSMENAIKMIDAAKACGCDCIKFQTFKADALVTHKAQKAEYQIENTQNSDSQYEMLKKLELSYDDFTELKIYCEKVGIDFMSTPFDEESVEVLEKIGTKTYKLSSGDITNKQLLQYVARKNKPMIISTGMCTLDEVREAIEWIEQTGNKKLTILHCTSNYPTPYEDVNMNAMLTLKKEFCYPIGYSDHTKGYVIPIMAVAMGAGIIEKHFTLDKNMEGPDHKASLDVNELKEMVEAIRIVEKAMGNGVKQPAKSELSTRNVARKSVILMHAVEKGTVLAREYLGIKRPGNGLEPKYIDNLIGKTVIRDMDCEELITWEDVQ